MRALGRKLHRGLAYAILLPSFVTFSTGVVLLLRQDFEWIQPRAQKAAQTGLPVLPLGKAASLAEQAYRSARSTDSAEVSSIEARLSKGTWVVRFKDGFEVQLDGGSGAVLGAQMRQTGWLIELHQGSWFHPTVMKAVFLPSGLLLLILWGTGVWMLRPRRLFR